MDLPPLSSFHPSSIIHSFIFLRPAVNFVFHFPFSITDPLMVSFTLFSFPSFPPSSVSSSATFLLLLTLSPFSFLLFFSVFNISLHFSFLFFLVFFPFFPFPPLPPSSASGLSFYSFHDLEQCLFVTTHTFLFLQSGLSVLQKYSHLQGNSFQIHIMMLTRD